MFWEFLDGPFKYQSHAVMQQHLHCVARVSKLVEHFLPIHAQSTLFDLSKNTTTAIIVSTIEYGGCFGNSRFNFLALSPSLPPPSISIPPCLHDEWFYKVNYKTNEQFAHYFIL